MRILAALVFGACSVVAFPAAAQNNSSAMHCVIKSVSEQTGNAFYDNNCDGTINVNFCTQTSGIFGTQPWECVRKVVGAGQAIGNVGSTGISNTAVIVQACVPPSQPKQLNERQFTCQ